MEQEQRLTQFERTKDTFTDMAVAQFEFEFIDANGNESLDWELAKLHATFSHKEACEFIFYTKHDDDYWEKLGFSEDILDLIRDARDGGYAYLCLYA